ncbi:MAG: 50S ribosomal protein L22 [Deltaproteobacteria bacterium]|nr:50S ribosomal protein L22 [Deltaproteobacteria bacterium]
MPASETKAAKKPKREKAKAEARKAARAAGPAQAHTKGIRISARKVRVLADQIRGKSVDFALTFLAFQQRAGAPVLKKAIDSAVANADQKKMDLDKLVVLDVQIDKAGMMRRYLPRAHGRATPIRKQLSHVHVRLAEKN